MPIMPDIDRVLAALSLVALLLYLTPAVFDLAPVSRRRLQWGAVLALAAGLVVAVAAMMIGSW